MYHVNDTTFMLETGQDWKIAALKASKCVCHFFWSDIMDDEYYMKIAIKEAIKARKKGDIPVGAVIVFNNKIISKAYNKKQKRKNPVLHAELIAISKASRKLKKWQLENCTLYVTLEPCLMCAGAIIQSRIKKIVYATESPKFGYVESVDRVFDKKNNHTPIIKKGICKAEASKLLKEFFENKRG